MLCHHMFYGMSTIFSATAGFGSNIWALPEIGVEPCGFPTRKFNCFKLRQNLSDRTSPEHMNFWLVVSPPPKKLSQLAGTNVPNHQPDFL